jgi:NAD(P)H-dependent FMN reductase
VVVLGTTIDWINNFSTIIPWTNNSSAVISWSGGTGGYTLYKTDAKQYGKYLGMTVTSSSYGIVYNGFEYEHELRVRF